MKKYIMTLVLMVTALAASAGYNYMKFTTADGQASTISADGLKITFADGVAVATAGSEQQSFTLAELAMMMFTNDAELNYNIYDVNRDTMVDVGDVNKVLEVILAAGNDSTMDVNRDNAVDVGDVNAILSHILEAE